MARNKRIIALVLTCAVLIGIGAWFMWDWDIEYEPVFSFESNELVRMESGKMVVWYGLNSNSYLPMRLLYDEYAQATGHPLDDDYELHPDEYTYIVCHGFTINRLVCDNMHVDRNGNGTSAPFYYPRIYAKLDSPYAVNVYRVKGMALDADPHNREWNSWAAKIVE